ncbi:MAG: hypothetical protein EP298_04060 [Gammaproteobacteria bacterium]|nr:MAG: hypothetical protein EP298_04060 [Gammaproteobacteria bacterium]UTW43805.1 hypothetical protein KFE69_06870 [bacterium SCSIO 12844]
MLKETKWLNHLGSSINLLDRISDKYQNILDTTLMLGNSFDQLGVKVKSINLDFIQSPLESINKIKNSNQLNDIIKKTFSKTESYFSQAIANINLNQSPSTQMMLHNPLTESYNLLLNQFNQIKSEALLSILSKVMPYLSSVLDAVNTWVIDHSEIIGNWLEQLISQLPEAKELINTMGNAITTLASVINHVVDLIGGWKTVIAGFVGFKVAAFIATIITAFQSLGSVIPIVSAAVNGLTIALQANPIGVAVTAIAFGAMLIIQYWQPILGFFHRLWQGIKLTFIDAINWMKPMISWVSDAISYAYKGIESIAAFLGWDMNSDQTLSDNHDNSQSKMFNQNTKFTTLNNDKVQNINKIMPINEIIENNHQNDAQNSSFKNHQNTTKVIDVKNYITLDGRRNDNTELIESAAFSGTQKAIALFDVDGGY